MVSTPEPVGKEADVKALPPLARRLKELREARGLSQMALAVRAGLSLSMVALIEQGQREDPRVSTLRALADALGVSLDELAPSETPPPAEPSAPKRRKRRQ
jgi:transcriptional regulator with XRE-family HTH domain